MSSVKTLAWKAMGSALAAAMASSSSVKWLTQVTGPNTSWVESLASAGGFTMMAGRNVVSVMRPPPMTLAPPAEASSIHPETRSASRG